MATEPLLGHSDRQHGCGPLERAQSCRTSRSPLERRDSDESMRALRTPAEGPAALMRSAYARVASVLGTYMDRAHLR